MAEKKETGFIKLQIPAGAAEPGSSGRSGPWRPGRQHHAVLPGVQRPDAGPGRHHHPVEITVYEDKSFTFVCKTPPAAVLIKEKLGIQSGSGIRSCRPWAR